MDPILSLVIVLVFALFLGELIHLLRLPRVLGYILSGFLLAGIGFAEPGEVIGFLKDLGVVFLFFFVGLGIDIKSLKRKLGRSVRLGFWTTLVSFIAGIIFSLVIGLDFFTAFIIGICASVSAQAVVAMVLDETGLLKRRLGLDIIDAGIVADIMQLVGISILFSFLPVVAQFSLSRLLLNWLILFGAIFLVKLLLFPLFARVLEKEKESRITFFLGGIILASVMGYLAEVLGIGSIIGALFAGAVIRHFFDRKIVNMLAHDFRLIGFGFLIPVLFVWTGYESSILGVGENILFGVILAVITIVGNIIGAAIALRKTAWRQKMLGGVGLAAKGDVEIILATVMLETGVIGAGIFSMIIMMSVTTMVLSPALFYIVAHK